MYLSLEITDFNVVNSKAQVFIFKISAKPRKEENLICESQAKPSFQSYKKQTDIIKPWPEAIYGGVISYLDVILCFFL